MKMRARLKEIVTRSMKRKKSEWEEKKYSR